MRGRERFGDLERRLALAQQRICELEGELDEHDRRDAVTGLCTLSQFGSRLDVEIERARRHGRPLSVAMLDVDGFRTLNAHHGRASGDRLLAAVGRVLTSYTRTSDLACRASADEFAVLFPEADGDEAGKCLERVLLELEATEVGPIACVSASAGIATYQRPQSAEQLLAEAGHAMDRARAGGGARAVLLDADSSRSLAEDAAQRDAVSGLAVALLERDRYTGEHRSRLSRWR